MRFILLRISEHFTGRYILAYFVGRALRALSLPHRPKDFIGVVTWLVSLMISFVYLFRRYCCSSLKMLVLVLLLLLLIRF